MHDPHSAIRLAKASVAALERGPMPEDLAEAPLADLWLVLVKVEGDLPVLWAQVSGHPLLGNCQVMTSPLIGLNREAEWARTFSRWYQLGEPFPIWKATLAAHLEDPADEICLLPFGSTGYRAIIGHGLLQTKMANVVSLLKNPDATGS